MADDLLHIVGYISIHGYCNNVYQIPLDVILSGTQTFTSYQTHMWNNHLVPCGYNAIISNSCPPVIVGGSKKGFHMHTSEINVLDVPNSSWKNIASLATTKLKMLLLLTLFLFIMTQFWSLEGILVEEVLKEL